ncbi:NAD(P)/FAD-dependent oxidoreductase [Amycolatopsis anabasis]|uniref:NAD(P)/FAD-dependent oxidoreductase n=1 Tax=Amycolatopsis anabasis TaxID=1840409 RepID=UPI00131EC0A2|nr:NAD(P)/FAD-dependent oxidoreductase [Amycolatopsis anabasis]
MTGGTVAILGGGISGLAAAHRLTRAGIPVTLLEASDQLGGLGTFFPYRHRWIERFYHCVLPTDEHLLPLLGELGLRDGISWRSTRMGMIADGTRYPFNSPVDLLRFKALTPFQRIRFGAVSVLLRRLGRGKDLDRLRTEDWLRGLYGDVIWDRVFRPMFGSKFGPSFGDVPALYLWQRLGREKNVVTRGYPAGGYKSIIDALRTSIEAGGGTVRTGTPVRSLRDRGETMELTLPGGETMEADHVLSTVPLPLLRTLAQGRLAERLPDPGLAYQGVVNALCFLRRPLDGHYWAPVLDAGAEFDGVIEMSALTGPETYGGRHLAYLMRYTGRDSALYAEDERDIAARWRARFLRLYADLPLTEDDIEEIRVFKAPFVEPVYPLGYLDRRPPVEVPGTRLLLATTAHIYPDVTSWNSSVGLAKRVTELLLARHSGTRVAAA